MGHYHSYEAEAKGLGTTVLDFTEEELRLDNRKPPNPQNNAGNISLRGNNDDVGSRHLHDYSLAYSEIYTKKDPHINRTNNSIRTNLHDQKPEEVRNLAKKKQREVRDINQAIQFAEDIQYLRFEANNTTNLNNNTMIVFNIPPIHEQLFLERQRGGPGMTFSDRYNKFLGEFEVTLDTFEHAQKKIKIHEISDNPKFKGDPKLLYSRFAAEEKSFHASRNKSDSRLEISQRDRLEMSHRDRHEMSYRDRHEMSQRDRLEMSQRDHPLNASIYSNKKSKTQVASEHSHEKSLNQSQMQNSSPYSRDQTKYHTFKADNNNYDAYSSQKNEDSHLESQRSPQNPFYDHNTSLLKKSPERAEKIEEHQITPRSSANKKVQVGGSLNQSLSQSQIRQSQTKTPPLTSQKVQQSQSKKMESSGSGHKSKKPVATTPQKHIPIVPSTAKTEVQDMQFQTPDSRTKTPPPRRTSPSPNAVQVSLKKGYKRSVSPNSGQKDSRIQYKSFWREGVRPKVVKKDTKRVPLKHESAKIKEGFETLAKTMKPNKLLNVNEKYVPLSQKKPQEQLFDRSHDYELVYLRPSIQKDQSPEPDNEQQQQQQSQRNSEKKKKIQKVTHADDNSKNKKKQTQENGNYDDYEEDEQENDEYQEQEEEEDYYEEHDQQEDISLVEDEYMTERYERAQRKKDGNYSNYGNNAEYVETSIDISSYLKNQQMPKFNQGKSSHQGNNYYENNQQEQEYEDEYQEQPEYYEREYELPSSQNDFRDQRHQQMRYAPKIRNKYTQERYEEDQGFDDHNYLHDILDRVRNLHDKMENSFSDITRDHSRIAEEDEDRPEEQKYSQFKRDPFHSARQDRHEQNEQVQNFPGSSKLKVSSKKLRPQGAR